MKEKKQKTLHLSGGKKKNIPRELPAFQLEIIDTKRYDMVTWWTNAYKAQN